MTTHLLTRRQFLLWSGAVGASVALPQAWLNEKPVRLGFVGLGGRGRQALSTCLGFQGARVVALCDRREDALQSALAGSRGQTGLATREARRLFEEPSVDAVVLAASQDKQFELTAAACAAGKDVFLLRPLPFHSPALKDVVQEAARQGRQVQIARETAFALEAGSAIGLAAASGAGITGAEIEAWFQTPEPPDGKPLFNDLLDEVDFAQAVVGGLVERSVTVGGPAILPGCWIDRRLHFKITDQQGIEKWMSINLIATHGSAALKATRTILRGDRGTAELAGLPLPAGNRMDLSAFLSAVRSREAGVGLSLSRTAQLNEQFLEVGKF